MKKKKFIFVTGGVTSSLGKGIISASIGVLLKSAGYKVTIQKFDPYLNIVINYPKLFLIIQRKRIARGQGSGRGGTSTKGHKGAQSRSGYSRKFGFEGGQMPLYRRIPKFGFRSPNRIEALSLIHI